MRTERRINGNSNYVPEGSRFQPCGACRYVACSCHGFLLCCTGQAAAQHKEHYTPSDNDLLSPRNQELPVLQRKIDLEYTATTKPAADDPISGSDSPSWRKRQQPRHSAKARVARNVLDWLAWLRRLRPKQMNGDSPARWTDR